MLHANTVNGTGQEKTNAVSSQRRTGGANLLPEAPKDITLFMRAVPTGLPFNTVALEMISILMFAGDKNNQTTVPTIWSYF